MNISLVEPADRLHKSPAGSASKAADAVESGSLWIAEKAISALFVFAFLFKLTPHQVLDIFTVLGQGHFLITYLYQYRRGAITRGFILAYLGCFALLFGADIIWPESMFLESFTGLYFVVHFSCDECHLLKKMPNRVRTLEILPLVVLYGGLILLFNYRLDFMQTCIGIALAMMVASLVQRKRMNSKLTGKDFYIYSSSFLVIALFWSGTLYSLSQFLGMIILFHYGNWYLNYYFRVQADRTRRSRYLRDIVVVNGLVFALFIAFQTIGALKAPLGLIFQPSSFYNWTLLHLIFSSRRSDLAFVVGETGRERSPACGLSISGERRTV